MGNLQEIKTFEPYAGSDIEDCIREAMEIAKQHHCIVKFNANGVPMKIYSFSHVQHQLKAYYEKMEKKHENK